MTLTFFDYLQGNRGPCNTYNWLDHDHISIFMTSMAFYHRMGSPRTSALANICLFREISDGVCVKFGRLVSKDYIQARSLILKYGVSRGNKLVLNKELADSVLCCVKNMGIFLL